MAVYELPDKKLKKKRYTQRKIKNESKCVTIKKSIKHKERQPEGKDRRATKKTYTFNRIIIVSYFKPIISLKLNGLSFPIKKTSNLIFFFRLTD